MTTAQNIAATVQRLESRYAGSSHFAAYRRVCIRFDADLNARATWLWQNPPR